MGAETAIHGATSAYDDYRSALVGNGYTPHPIGPGTKKPMVIVDGEYKEIVAWQLPDRSMAPSPQPGAGVGVRLGLQRSGVYLVALDWDDEDVAIAGMDLLPMAVCKEGQRGYTSFFVSRTEIPSRDFRVNGKCVVQVLSVGRQTVLPPSVHPDTGLPYVWSTVRTLLDTSVESLPELPADYVTRIEDAIKGAGLIADIEEEPKPKRAEVCDEDSPYAQLNKLALRNLEKWVPDLGLYKCRRKVGRFASYEAVATWRESTTGRPKEERKLNLQISGARGIKDFGTDQGYSPINLVMVALPCGRAAAIGWLQERLFPSTVSDAGLDKLIKNLKEPASNGDDGSDSAADAKAEVGAEDEDTLAALTGAHWEFGDPLPEPVEMLVPHFVPRRGVGYLGGEWSTFKTFVLNDLGVGVADGSTFAGQQVSEAGCVMQIELEGSQNEVRITGAADARGIKHKLPIWVFTQLPPKIIGTNKRVTAEWKKYCRGMKVQAGRMAEKFGTPVRLLTIDPVNTVAGWTDEQSSAEGQAVYEGLLYLSDLLECVVVAADHYGKAPGQGLRGTSVKETAALFILGTSKRDSDLAARRFMEVRKMKNGHQNIAMDFFMDEHRFFATRKVEKDGTVTFEEMDVKTLAIRWDGEIHPTDEKTDCDEPTPQQHKMLSALKELMRTKSTDSSNGKVVASKDWEEKCLADKICPSKAAFRNQKSVMRGKFIGVSESGDSVWFMAA